MMSVKVGTLKETEKEGHYQRVNDVSKGWGTKGDRKRSYVIKGLMMSVKVGALKETEKEVTSLKG